MTIGNIFLTF